MRSRRARHAAAMISLAAVITLASSGCAARAAGEQQRAGPARADSLTARATSATKPMPLWLQTLQMVSARTGWALAWSGNPNERSPVTMTLVRTRDGGRTWTDVTPVAARPLITSLDTYFLLFPGPGERAWLAVTRQRSNAESGTTRNRIEVFGTSDGGRTWTTSSLIHAPGVPGSLDFVNSRDGWLLENLGEAMNLNPVQVYMTTDGGRRWSLIAKSPPGPQGGTSRSGLPVSCIKAGIGFATQWAGWISGACFTLSDALLATTDGGLRWAAQPVPVAASTCQSGGCEVTSPQFFGRTGFVSVGTYPGPGYLLTSRNLGATWSAVRLPPGNDPYPTATFFSARDGVLIPTGPQESHPRVFYDTANGGRTWRPVPQGHLGTVTTIEFTSPSSGFAWNLNQASPLIYATANGGRSWSSFVPLS